MNQEEQQVQQIELSMQEAKARIKDAEALDKLYKNKDFKHLFLDGYFLHEASRAVLLKADPSMQESEKQKDCDNIITGIGMLRQYFAKVFTLGTMAQKSLQEDKEAMQEVLAEESLEGDTLQ